jgi:cytochrome c-type biogenesis protein CcmE
MSQSSQKYLKFGLAIGVIVIALSYLAYTGVKESQSYYVTISELRKMGDDAYSKHLRVSGFVKPGTIKQSGTHAEFVLLENGLELPVSYKGSEPAPDTFKDNAQALAIGDMGKDGVFRANQLQAKCASKYVAQQDGTAAAAPGAQAPTGQMPAKSY